MYTFVSSYLRIPQLLSPTLIPTPISPFYFGLSSECVKYLVPHINKVDKHGLQVFLTSVFPLFSRFFAKTLSPGSSL